MLIYAYLQSLVQKFSTATLWGMPLTMKSINHNNTIKLFVILAVLAIPAFYLGRYAWQEYQIHSASQSVVGPHYSLKDNEMIVVDVSECLLASYHKYHEFGSVGVTIRGFEGDTCRVDRLLEIEMGLATLRCKLPKEFGKVLLFDQMDESAFSEAKNGTYEGIRSLSKEEYSRYCKKYWIFPDFPITAAASMPLLMRFDDYYLYLVSWDLSRVWFFDLRFFPVVQTSSSNSLDLPTFSL